jgi:hypothetical protein
MKSKRCSGLKPTSPESSGCLAAQGLTYYRKALERDPDHLSALEYLGELYVETGELVKAKEILAKLEKLCCKGVRSGTTWPRRSPTLRVYPRRSKRKLVGEQRLARSRALVHASGWRCTTSRARGHGAPTLVWQG